jgi:hypothetical protein
MTTVRVRHIRQAGFCASGARDWFRRHDLDYPAFLRDGVDAEVLEKLGDHFGNQVVALARAEEQAQLKEADDGR